MFYLLTNASPLSRVESCCTKCRIRLVNPSSNTIKQHATMCNKCFMFMKCCTRFNMSSKIKSTKECGLKTASTAHARIQQSTTKLHGVAKRVQHHTTSRETKNIVSNNICLVKIAIKRHTRKYNTIQQGGQTSATFHTTSKLYDVV